MKHAGFVGTFQREAARRDHEKVLARRAERAKRQQEGMAAAPRRQAIAMIPHNVRQIVDDVHDEMLEET